MRLVRADGLPHVTLALAEGSAASQARHAHDSLVLGVVLAGVRRIETPGHAALVPAGSVFAIPPGLAHACAPAISEGMFNDSFNDNFNDTFNAGHGQRHSAKPAPRNASRTFSGAAANAGFNADFNDVANDKSGANAGVETAAPVCSYLAFSIAAASLPPDLGGPGGPDGLSGLAASPPRLDDPDLAGALRRLGEALLAPAGWLERQSLLAECLERLAAHCGAGPAEAGGGVESELVGRARRLLEEHLEAGMDLATLAEACGTGAFALHRAFTREVGLPPHAFQTHMRLRRAKGLLRAGAGLAEAALAAGFCDQAHMTRHFARSVGVSPAAYARAHRSASGGKKG